MSWNGFDPQAKAQQPYLGRVILEFLNDGVAIIGRDLKIINCNNAYLRRYNIPREEAIGHYCYYVSHGTKTPCPEEICPVRTAFKQQKPAMMVHRHEGRKGQESFSDVMAIPLRYADEKATEVLEVVRDNTEVHVLNKRLNWMLNFVAHELQGALGNAVMNISALMNKKLSRRISANDRREMLVSAMSSLKFIHDMARNCLLSAKAKSGQLLYRPSMVNFATEVFDPVLAGLKPALAQKNMRIVQPVKSRDRIWCDRDLMRICLNNLINNAAKYGAEASTIISTSCRRKGVFEFSIANQGPQIPQDKLKEIFDEFVRLTSSGSAGTGLGLYVVRTIVEMHGGRVIAQSGRLRELSRYKREHWSEPWKRKRVNPALTYVRFILTIPQRGVGDKKPIKENVK